MKINFFLPYFIKSGGVKIIYAYAKFLSDKGYDVCIYYPFFPQTYKYSRYNLKILKLYLYEFKENIKCYLDFKKKTSSKIRMVPFIINSFVRDAGYSISTTWHTTYWTKELSERKGKKVYFVQDYENWGDYKYYLDKSFSFDFNIITTSNRLQRLLKNDFGRDSVMIPYGIDFSEFYIKNKNKSFELKKIVFVSSNDDRKNLKSLFKIITQLHNEFPDLEFNSFGFIDKIENLPEFVNYYMDPGVKKINDLYNEAQLFLLPSKYEGFGIPPAEAMACKCAVISTNVGAIPDYIENKVSGLIVNDINLFEMHSLVRMLKSNPEYLRSLAENGYKSVRKHFDWNISVDEFIETLKSFK